jgi:hypothetical protein
MPLSAAEVALISSGCTLAGVLLTALIAGVYTLRAKHNEYINDYYKTVIQRRIAAYEQLENLIVEFKVAVVDKDNRPYHFPFSRENPKVSVLARLYSLMDQALWLSDEALVQTRELNYLLFRMPDAEAEAIDFGKQHYQDIAGRRETLENILATDILDLHKVSRFLMAKKKSKSGFKAVQLYPTEAPKK